MIESRIIGENPQGYNLNTLNSNIFYNGNAYFGDKAL